jgi:hypothetical protein
MERMEADSFAKAIDEAPVRVMSDNKSAHPPNPVLFDCFAMSQKGRYRKPAADDQPYNLSS